MAFQANPQLEMRKRNNQFLQKVRDQKPTNPVSKELEVNPIGKWAVGLLGFAVFGGREYSCLY